jgi:AcrR family transcriptional regulator
MNDGAMDKRSLRTRQAIETALLRLIETRGYSRVSVREICDEAEVSRSTFYAHYADKDDLKRSGLRHLRLELDNHQAGADACCAGSSLEQALFEHAARYRNHYRALVRGGVAAMVLESVRKIVAETIRKKLRSEETDAKSREAAVQFLAGGYVALLTGWLDGDETTPPPNVGAVLQRIYGAQFGQQPASS